MFLEGGIRREAEYYNKAVSMFAHSTTQPVDLLKEPIFFSPVLKPVPSLRSCNIVFLEEGIRREAEYYNKAVSMFAHSTTQPVDLLKEPIFFSPMLKPVT